MDRHTGRRIAIYRNTVIVGKVVCSESRHISVCIAGKERVTAGFQWQQSSTGDVDKYLTSEGVNQCNDSAKM